MEIHRRGYTAVQYRMLHLHFRSLPTLDCIRLDKVIFLAQYIVINHFFLGVVALSGGVNFTLDSDSQFTLTCISTGGPATTVTWTRDSTTVTERTKTVLVNAEYIHTLEVNGSQEGVYTCAISNRLSIISAELDIAGENSFLQYFMYSLIIIQLPPHPLM